jgi:hypothetical protein
MKLSATLNEERKTYFHHEVVMCQTDCMMFSERHSPLIKSKNSWGKRYIWVRMRRRRFVVDSQWLNVMSLTQNIKKLWISLEVRWLDWTMKLECRFAILGRFWKFFSNRKPAGKIPLFFKLNSSLDDFLTWLIFEKKLEKKTHYIL